MTELETGKPITYLLADVEGLARGWLDTPEEMARAIATQRKLVDAVVAASGGTRSDDQDSAVAMFEHPLAGVRAAIEIQVALAAQPSGLPMRMGLHADPATPLTTATVNRFQGLSMMLAARLRDAGHGGQILVSDTVAQSLTTSRSDVHMRQLGAHYLRDSAEPETVWQVEDPRLRSEFPPLRTAPKPGRQPPISLTSFVGREADTAALHDWLREARLVTIVGPGGCGKTRLAQRVATSFDRPALWSELAAITDPAEVAGAIAESCGLNPASALDVDLPLIEQLRVRGDTLLVIDNGEQVIDALAKLIERMLSACPMLRLLVTSREPVNAAGERVWRVASLPTPPATAALDRDVLRNWDATRLFVDRAEAVALTSLVLDASACALIVRICERLDGIPLAIELAATRTRSMRLDDVASSLDDAVGLLVGGSRTQPSRQQTIRASIEWSERLLSASERVALARLAIFVGTFERAAAVQVIGDAGRGDSSDREMAAASEMIDALVDKSLLRYDHGTGRLQLLQVVRQYVQERAGDEPGYDAAQVRYYGWYAQLAEWFGMGGLRIDEQTLLPDHADLFNAMDIAMAALDPTDAYRMITGLAPRWHLIGRFERMHRAATWVLSRPPSDGPERWAAAVARVAYQAVGTGRTDFEAFIDEAHIILEDAADTESLLYLDYWPAVVAAYSGDLEPSNRMLADARRFGADVLFMSVTRNLVSIHAMCGRYELARTTAESAFDVALAAGRDVGSTESTHAFLASALALQGDVVAAKECLLSGDYLGIVGRPHGALVHAMLGAITNDGGLIDAARSLLVGEVHPINGSLVARTRSILCRYAGDVVGALAEARSVPPSPLETPRCFFALLDAELLVELGDIAGATEALDDAERNMPPDAPLLTQLLAGWRAHCDSVR
jgi:predicted ATPase/class 3 adenylate cyclase